MISADQVTALAPDAASFKAGKALAVPSKWSGLGRSEVMLWGLAKGSGSKPYKTQVVLGEFVCQCSCPSRKFPCKHALGLMFLAADDLSGFTAGELPDWVREWADSRAARKEKAATKKKAKPRNESTAARTREKRAGRVDEGVELLTAFLLDMIRQGLGQASSTAPDTWKNMSKRLIDCQAPGLARAVNRMADTMHSGANWEQRLLHEMGSLHLLLHSYKTRDALDESMRAEVEQRIGWQVDKDAVLGGNRIRDDWFVAFRTVATLDRLTAFSNWVYGQQTKQWALMLSFATANSAPAALWPVGGVVSTELAFYPGVVKERALATDEQAGVKLDLPFSGTAETIDQLMTRVAHGLAHNPWQHRVPFILMAQPVTDKGQLVLADSAGQALPLQATGSDQRLLQSLCGGHPTMLAGEWDGRHCRLYAASDSGNWFSLPGAAR